MARQQRQPLPRDAALALALLLFSSASAFASHRPEVHNPLELIPVHAVQVDLDGSVALGVNSTALERSGQSFRVWWSGISEPSVGDLIAVYAADADPAKTAPKKFKPCVLDPKHLATGSGSLE